MIKESFNEFIEFVDCADVMYDLTATFDIDDEDAFYFYEECQDTGLFKTCKTVDEVSERCIEEFIKQL